MKDHRHILKYGIRNGIEYHISEVESGLKCDCVCPACGEQLNAKKGENIKPQYHFAHKSKIQCEYAYETSIHYDGKRILEKNRTITLPIRVPTFDAFNLNGFYNKNINMKQLGTIIPKTYQIENVFIEKKLHDIVPDINCTIKGKPIIIEIAVTSKIKVEKQKKIENIGIPVIEVDLSKMNRTVDEKDLELNVIENINNKTWYCNTKDEDLIDELLFKHQMIMKKIVGLVESKKIIGYKNNLKVNECPMVLARFKDKRVELDRCKRCRSNLSTQEFYAMCGYKNYLKIKAIIEETNKTSP